MTALRAALTHALLAVHLVVFVLGGAFVTRSPTHGPPARAAVAALASSGDGTAVVTPAEGRLERTRPRGDRGERGGGSPHLDFVVPRSGLGVAPASFAGSLTIAAAAADHRLLPSVVHGPRGPPHAC